MKLTTILSILLASASLLAGCNPVKDSAAAERAVTEFHALLDKSDSKGVYSAAHPDLKAATTEKDFVEFLDAVHRKLGTVQVSKMEGWRINSFNFKTDILLDYTTKFNEGDATETFDYRIEGDKAVLRSYHINSRALILK